MPPTTQTSDVFYFKVETGALKDAIKAVSGVVPKVAVPAIIGSIMITLQDDGLLRIQATDLKTHLVILVRTLEQGGSGSICVPADRIKSVIDSIKLKDVLVNVNLQGFEMLLSAGRKDASVKGYDSIFFPALDNPNGKMQAAATIPIDVFKDMVKKVAIAAATEDTRAYLTGVQISFENDKLVMVATDSYRAAMTETESLNQPLFSTILPAVDLKAIVETLSQLATVDSLTIQILENTVHLTADNVKVQLTPLAGIYPKVKGAFANAPKTSMVISTQAFLEAIRFVSSFQGDLEITTEATGNGKGLLKIYCTDGQSGEGSDAVDVALKGNPIKVAMNAAYLEPQISLYNQLKIPELVLQFAGNNSPMIIKPYYQGDIDEEFAAIIMPMGEKKGAK